MINKQLGTALAVLLLAFLQVAQSQSTTSVIYLPAVLPCVAYEAGNCISCPFDYHINQNQCYKNITNCVSYRINSNGAQQCSQCNIAAVSDGKGGCVAGGQLRSQSSESALLSADQAAARYGDNRFVVIPLDSALGDPFFQICNNYMLKGQYKHFILKTIQPVYSVAFFSIGNQYQYKILYKASGGGLMMCIISVITTTNVVTISSFVSIGVTNIIDNCGFYDTAQNCLQCIDGYHLQDKKCYRSLDSCISHYGYICLQCERFHILVQNRCISCRDMGDLGKIVFYGALNQWLGSYQQPTLTQSYLVQ